MEFLLASLWLFVIISQGLALIVAIVARLWVLRPEPVVLRGIDVERASNLVAVYIEGIHDHRFAFPTGVFIPEEVRPGTVVAKEGNFKGSAGFGVLKFAILIPAIGFDAGSEFGCLGSAIGGMLGGMVAVFFLGPIIMLGVLDVIYRKLLRSRIDATITAAPGGEDSVRVQLELRGLSAFGVERTLVSGFNAAKVPSRFRTGRAAEVHAVADAGRDRFQRVFATAAAAAIVLAVGSAALGAGRVELGETPSEPVSYLEEEPPPVEEADPAVEEESGVLDDDTTADGSGDSGLDEPVETGEPDRTTASYKMERAVRRHWNGRLRGTDRDLEMAYSLYGPEMKRKAGTLEGWKEGIRADGLQDIGFLELDGRVTGRGTGRVDLGIRTESDEGGCKVFDIQYTMKRSGERWLLWDSSATDSGC